MWKPESHESHSRMVSSCSPLSHSTQLYTASASASRARNSASATGDGEIARSGCAGCRALGDTRPSPHAALAPRGPRPTPRQRPRPCQRPMPLRDATSAAPL
eukprot:2559488-Prymnesium_polylepis.1